MAEVLDVGEAERTTAVLVAGELGDGCGSIVLVPELDHTGAARATVGLVLDLGALNFSDGREELNEVVVAGAPWQLSWVSWACLVNRMAVVTYVAHEDDRAWLGT